MGCIHLSQATYDLLSQHRGLVEQLECTGGVEVKGKGNMVSKPDTSHLTL